MNLGMILETLAAKNLYLLVEVNASVNRWYKLFIVRLFTYPVKEPFSLSLNCFNLTGHSFHNYPFGRLPVTFLPRSFCTDDVNHLLLKN